MRHSRREKILSLMLAFVLALLILLPDDRNTSISEEITVDPENTVIPLDEGPDDTDIDLDLSGKMDEDVEDINIDLDLSSELEEGEVAAFTTEAPAVTPEHFEQGYVRVRREDDLYADPDLTELAGAFLDSGLVYARIFRVGEPSDEDVLLVRFDTPDILAANRDPETGYIRFGAVSPLAPEDAAKAGETLKDEGARSFDGVLLPVIAFEAADEEPEPTEAPEAEPTEAPEAEPTEVPEAEATEAPEAEATEAPEAEATEAPEAEPTEAPEAESTEAPEAEATEAPEVEPTAAPEAEATEAPEAEAIEVPEAEATEAPEAEATEAPEAEATEAPEAEPTAAPEAEPTEAPKAEPTAAPEGVPEVVPVDLLGRTVADRVNLRAEPNIDCAVLAVIETKGTEVAITGAVDVDGVTWYRVPYEGIEGYVRGNLLEVRQKPEGEAGKDETFDLAPGTGEDTDGTEVTAEDGEEALAAYPAFEESKPVEGVLVKVTAGEGVFPEGSTLSVRRVPVRARKAVREAVEQERDEDVNVAVSYVFDIKVLAPDGQEIDFTAEQGVQVSFSAAEVANENLETQVYHVAEEEDGSLTAQPMDVTITEGETATVTTDGFSYYTVEFTYNKLQYVMEGDSTIPLAKVLDFVGLTGEVTAVEVSDSSLFSASNETGEWLVTAWKPFTTDEWMRVVIGGIDFEIEYMFLVTDDIPFPPAYNGGNIPGRLVQSGTNQTFLPANSPRATICIDGTKLIRDNAKVTIEKDGFADDGAQIYYTGTELPMNNKTTFSGECFHIDFEDAAILGDGTRKTLRMTFSDVSFMTPGKKKSNGKTYDYGTRTYGPGIKTFVAFLNNNTSGESQGVGVRSGNDGTYIHVGLEVRVNIHVIGAKKEDTFYHTMSDIDIKRDYGTNHSALFGAAEHFNYSEQVEIVSGARSEAYIPAGNYKSGVTVGAGTLANGLLFTPITGDENTFYTGFGVLADAYDGISLTIRSAAGSYSTSGKTQTVNTCALSAGVGQLYARKVVDGAYATDSDYARDWTLAATVHGETFAATAKHDDTRFIGNFMKGWNFDLTESAQDMDDYDTTYKVEYGPSLDYINDNNGGQYYMLDSSGDGKSASGIIQCCNLVTFTNKRKFEPLTVKKTVVSDHEEDLNKDWRFTLKVTDGFKDMPYTLLDAPEGAQNWQALTDEEGNRTGVYTFTLKHNDSLEITLPLGCKYEIAEAPDRDFVAAFIPDHEGTLKRDTTVTARNSHRTEHDLTLDKRVEGNMGNYGKYFRYDVNIKIPVGHENDYTVEGDFDPAPMVNARERITDATQPGNATDKVHLYEGENTFTVWLAHGDTFTIKDLPSGTGYSITETNDLDYQVSTAIVGDTRYGDAASTHPIALAQQSRDTSVTVSDTSLNKTTDVSYTNYRNESIPTGIYDDVRAALWGLATVLALGLVQTHCAARRDKRRTMRARRS